MDLDASLALSLAPEWPLSVIYPVVPIKMREDGQGDQVRRNVSTLGWDSDGDEYDARCRLSVLGSPVSSLSVLFDSASSDPWYLSMNYEMPISPPPSPSLYLEHFSPLSSNLNNYSSVLLPVEDITSYLDRALKTLGLHIKARTFFIT
jgi:hypothetical protein